MIEAGIGMNRTGIGLSPILSSEMIDGSTAGTTVPSEQLGEIEIARVRSEYATQRQPLGSVPPPSSLKGAAKTAVDVLKGQQPTVLLDRLGDRLAFERTGVRLYEALLDKFEALETWEGGPLREELAAIQQDELRHFELLREAIESLGADPTAMTPAADASGVEAMGVLQVVLDPRTTLTQALHAILTVELVDNDSWRILIELCREMGHTELVSRMQAALRDEERHLFQVRSWLVQEARLAARRELSPQPGTRT
jgi:rubrerythrin